MHHDLFSMRNLGKRKMINDFHTIDSIRIKLISLKVQQCLLPYHPSNGPFSIHNILYAYTPLLMYSLLICIFNVSWFGLTAYAFLIQQQQFKINDETWKKNKKKLYKFTIIRKELSSRSFIFWSNRTYS